MLKLYRDDVEIADNIPEGSPYTGVVGLYVGDPQDGYEVTINPELEPEQPVLDQEGNPIPWLPNPNWPEVGAYRFEAMEEEIPPEPTIEELRAGYSIIGRVNFAKMLASIETPEWPEGILPSDVEHVISQIPDEKAKQLTLWEFNNAQFFERINPLIDGLGTALMLSPEQIDGFWNAFNASN